jgi:subtilisin family serine protease
MDVISMSLGTLEATRIERDIEVAALGSAAALGVIVVVAAGNDGPDPFTIGSPGTAPGDHSGSSKNDRTFAATVTVDGTDPALAIPGSHEFGHPITAP